MDTVIGSNTAVYVGIFNGDYERILHRDPERMPFYQATGTGAAVLSNRISYFFDLKGPSMTIDTGCSGSMVALHLACQSLRTGESRQAIVGGSNLILDPSQMIPMSYLKYLLRPVSQRPGGLT
jgi:acyl transferase domain-containing protein